MEGSDRMGNRVNPYHTAHELGLHYFSERETNKQYALESLETLMLMLCFVVSDAPGSDCLLGRLAPVLKTIFHQYTCSQSYYDGSVLKQSHQSKTGYKYMI